MRIIIVISEMAVGGAEVGAVEFVRAMTGRGHAMAVAALRRGGPLAAAFRSAGAEMYEGLAPQRFTLSGPLRMARVVRKFRPDAMIVIDAPRNSLFYGTTGAMLSGRRVPRLCWCNSIPGGQNGDIAGRFAPYYKLGLLNAVVCVSDFQRRKLIQRDIPPDRLLWVPNGVDLAKFSDPGEPSPPLTVPPGRTTFVQVANVMPDKDFSTLLAAAQRLAGPGDFHLLLVGRGTDSPEMHERIGQMNLDDCVSLCGQRKDVPQILGAADVFVLSSHSEVMSVATLEAMAAGLPVIVSDIPAFEGIITDGENGLLAHPDDAEHLAAVMAKLIDEPDLRRRLAVASRASAEQYGIEAVCERFENVLHKLIARQSVR